MASKGFDWDYYYPDDGIRFSFEDMEHYGYKAYWVSLRLRTDYQKNVFRFIYDHPGCVAGDMRLNLGIDKNSLMSVLRGLLQREVIRYEEGHPRPYYVNQELIDEILNDYKQRIFKRFPDVRERCEKRAILEAAKDEIIAIHELIAEEDARKAEEEKKKAEGNNSDKSEQ